MHRRIGAGVAVAGGLYASSQLMKRHKRPDTSTQQVNPLSSSQKSELVIPRTVKDAICGAAGELLQILLLYPVEAIKVRCQEQGIGATTILSQLIKNGRVASLWSGIRSSALLSILVGSIHWLSFSAAKRLVTVEGGSLQDEVRANFIAAGIGAISTAIVESPVEEFRHRAQAGLISGSLSKEMLNSVKRFGVLSLYASFLPFLVEALPYDIAELSTYSNLTSTFKELERTAQPGSLMSCIVKGPPEGSWDLILGGAAGGAAVLISMPCDTIKTMIQTGTSRATGPRQQVREFLRIGRRLVAERGVGALFVGVTPRLLQQVPGSALCWWGVQAADKIMKGIKEE